ncbi:hypothetical protein MMC11_000912 [Xylographa trunciseda]|nr:hypothetical protein [Xylographa trunciseda]
MFSGQIKAEDTCLTNRNDGPDPDRMPYRRADEEATSGKTGVPSKETQDVELSNLHSHPEDPGEIGDFPEGGARAWSVVFGSTCALTAVFGVINTTAVFQQFLSSHQLSGYDASTIGWIFSFGLFLTFFGGVQVGPVFDARGPRVLMLVGSILLFLSMMLLGECTEYWHFFTVYGLIGGLGGACINTPAVACVGHYFLVKRGAAMGVAFTSGSIGGVFFPLMLQQLFPLVGFAWSTRILAFVLLLLLILANLLVRSRLPPTPGGRVLPDFSVFKDLALTFCTLGIFFLEWGLFVPLAYISSYAVDHGRSTAFGFQIVAVLNAGSFFGRFIPGLVSDKIGRYNTIIITIVLCIVTIFGLWLPAQNSEAILIIFATCFGFSSGSNLSLTPVCVGQLCKTEQYGRYYSTCYTIVSFGTLTGVPIAGQILSTGNGSYTGLIIFAGGSYVVALACFIASRACNVGFAVRTNW